MEQAGDRRQASISLVTIVPIGILAVAVGLVGAGYGLYLEEDTGRLVEARILGGWLLSIAGLGLVVAAQVAARRGQVEPDIHPDVPGWRSQVVRPAVGLLSGGAGLIHFAVIAEHFEEHWLFGTFFVVLGVFQMAWALAIVTHPARWLVVLGMVVNGGVVGIYLWSRLVGLPLGPEAGEAIPAGFGDVMATVFEVLIVVVSLPLLQARSEPRLRLVAATTVTAVLSLAVAAVTALALISAAGGSIFIPPAE
jgi:hypothetical protein